MWSLRDEHIPLLDITMLYSTFFQRINNLLTGFKKNLKLGYYAMQQGSQNSLFQFA